MPSLVTSGSFIINRFLSHENDLGTVDAFMMNAYFLLKRLGISDEKACGLDYQNVTTEQVALRGDPPKPFGGNGSNK